MRRRECGGQGPKQEAVFSVAVDQERNNGGFKPSGGSGVRSCSFRDTLEAEPRVTDRTADAGVQDGVPSHPVKSSAPYCAWFMCTCIVSLPYFELG